MELSGSESDGRFTVAFLGPLGTYTHEAAYKRFADHAQYLERKTIAGETPSTSTLITHISNLNCFSSKMSFLLSPHRFPLVWFLKKTLLLGASLKRATRFGDLIQGSFVARCY